MLYINDPISYYNTPIIKMQRSFLKSFKKKLEDSLSDSEMTSVSSLDISLMNANTDEDSATDDKSGAKILKINTLRGKFSEISETEEIINDFSCALKKDLLLHGRLFIGVENFYFLSNILSYETKVAEKWSNVLTVKKAKLANIIPNSIRIDTTDGKYVFTSFVSRAYPFELLSLACRNQKEKLGMKGTEVRDSVKSLLEQQKKKSSKNKKEMYDSTPSINLSLIDDEPVEQTASSLNRSRKSAPNLDVSTKKDFVIKSVSENCACKKYKHTIVSKIFNVNIDDIFNVLYDDGSFLMKNVYTKCNFEDYTLVSNENQQDGSILKTITNVLPKAFLGKNAKNTVKITFPHSNKPNKHYEVSTLSNTEGVPYSDTFEVLTRTCLLKFAENKTFYKCWLEVNFKKQGWTIPKDTIEKSSLKTSQNIHEEIIKELTILYGPPTEIDDHSHAQKPEKELTQSIPESKIDVKIQPSNKLFYLKLAMQFGLLLVLFFSLWSNLQQKMVISRLEAALYICQNN